MRDYTKFFTPPEIADLLVTLADIQSGQLILEPHAGIGNLIVAARKKPVNLIHAAELNPSFVPDLHEIADLVFVGDFLKMPLKPVYDRIIANPPFGNETDLWLHFIKMHSVLKPTGMMAAIVPETFQAKHAVVEYPIENWSSNKDGTTTKIKIVVIKAAKAND